MPSHHHPLMGLGLGLGQLEEALDLQNQTWMFDAAAAELIVALESLELRRDRPEEIVLFAHSWLQLLVAVATMTAAEWWTVVGYWPS